MLERELQDVLRRMPRWERERAGRVDELNQEITEFAVGHLIGALRDRYAEVEDVVEHLEAVRRDIVRSVWEIVGAPPGAASGSAQPPTRPSWQRSDNHDVAAHGRNLARTRLVRYPRWA